jgi:hypothetical protein
MSKDPHPMSESIEGLVEELTPVLEMCEAGKGHNPGMISVPTEKFRSLLEAASVLLSLQGGNSSSSASLPAAPDGATESQHSAGDYEALGRACERHGLAWFAADGEMLFQAPDDVIADAAREPLFEKIAALKAENARLIRELSNFCGDA